MSIVVTTGMPIVRPMPTRTAAEDLPDQIPDFERSHMPHVQHRFRSAGLRTIAVLLCMTLAACTSTPTLQDASGLQHTPLQGESGDVVVVVFSSTDCPIANAMAPDLERAHKEAAESGARFYLVHARRDLTTEPVRTHAKKYALTMPVLVDRDHALVEALNASVTPEAVVLRFSDPNDYEILYQGSVNNLYSSVGNRRKDISEYHLRDAIRVAAAGGTPDVKSRPPFGCYIERSP